LAAKGNVRPDQTDQLATDRPKSWALQDAKARFSEVVRRANTDGPQIVTYRGVE